MSCVCVCYIWWQRRTPQCISCQQGAMHKNWSDRHPGLKLDRFNHPPTALYFCVFQCTITVFSKVQKLNWFILKALFHFSVWVPSTLPVQWFSVEQENQKVWWPHYIMCTNYAHSLRTNYAHKLRTQFTHKLSTHTTHTIYAHGPNQSSILVPATYSQDLINTAFHKGAQYKLEMVVLNDK